MSTNHTHNQLCAHALLHCGYCEVAYCSKCGREWISKYSSHMAWQSNGIGSTMQLTNMNPATTAHTHNT